MKWSIPGSRPDGCFGGSLLRSIYRERRGQLCCSPQMCHKPRNTLTRRGLSAEIPINGRQHTPMFDDAKNRYSRLIYLPKLASHDLVRIALGLPPRGFEGGIIHTTCKAKSPPKRPEQVRALHLPLDPCSPPSDSVFCCSCLCSVSPSPVPS